ncbi:hypothetical protein H4R33_003904 [Dimargaris cristalligena]|uniref:protein-tyrosine-phosphatase n=1 Tax=Dimargaris cristalligena TaxID=215637 RepID=A0A4P9ZTR6_9FUNG|nr:hypothetical protein H4R33_003904 [Dimargaris cristalligena]RKP36887.1 protein-tyrosine phosphatase-like protein [Dimargaris cristalligena]|eukprot:RKP36887.1 protein-tyrosine phosphatase-like protein [Dimargaris cristalligena]
MPSVKNQRLITPPTYVEYQGLKFLILDAPSNNTLPIYLKEMERYKVTDIVRACDATYSKHLLEARNIEVHDWSFPDGAPPPPHIVDQWLRLVQKRFEVDGSNPHNATIAVHCVAGLGRAPILVAIALIEYGMSPLDSVQFIRSKRNGAINRKQLQYVEAYKRRSKGRCSIM